jgi:uncharacterized protein YggT (Ycf19 family)
MRVNPFRKLISQWGQWDLNPRIAFLLEIIFQIYT